MHKSMLFLLLLLAAAFSGCLGDDGDGSEDTPDGDDEESVDPTTIQDATEKWFLHRTGDCADGDEVFMDQKNSGGDADGCGAVGAISPTGSVAESFPSKGATGGFSSGTDGTATIYLATAHPTQLTVNVELRIGDNVVATGEAATAQTESVFGAVIEYTAFEIPFTTDADISPGAELTLDLIIGGATESYFIGYEDDHASGLVIA